MRGTVAKKIRQLYRRDYRARIDAEQGFLRQVLKPKPRWMPRWFWILGSKIYFNDYPWVKFKVMR